MSKKTIKKRIALVAASAMTAGFLSVISAPVANAAAGDGILDGFRGEGIVGALTPTIAAHPTKSTTRTAVVLTTGELQVSTAAVAAIKVSAGAIVTGYAGAATQQTAPGTAGTTNGSQNCGVIGQATDFIKIKPIGAAGSTFTISNFDDDCDSNGTAQDVITVTIAATNVAGVPSVADSNVRWDTNDTGDAPTAAEDITNSSTTTGNPLYLRINVKDAYAQDISATTGSLIVTATSGSNLSDIAASGATAAPSTESTTRVSTADPSPLWIRVLESTAGKGWSGTVTVTYNGVVLATKSGQITGAPASIAVQAYKNAKTSATSGVDSHLYTVKDAAGNGLAFTSSDLAYYDSSNSAIASGVATGAVNASSSSAYGANVGSLKAICSSGGSAGGGVADVRVSYTLSNGTVIISNKFPVTCGGDGYSYSASFDKASYIQGEVATLTVKFTDSKGNQANSSTAVATDPAGDATTDVAISVPMMALVGSLSAAADTKVGLGGTLTYKFTVGTASGLTAGKYNAVVNFPTLSNANAVSVSYQVGTGTTDVSNAEVLKSIVALIASINKQIAALQKLILKR